MSLPSQETHKGKSLGDYKELACSRFYKVGINNGGIVALGASMGISRGMSSKYANPNDPTNIPYHRILMASVGERIEFYREDLIGLGKVEPTQFDDLNGEVIDEYLDLSANDGELAIQVKMESVNVETINKAIDLLCKMKAEL